MNAKYVVITLAIGKSFEEMGKFTHPLMKRYAEKCNAEFIVLDQRKLDRDLGLVTYEKLQVFDYLDGTFDKVLFIDTDVVVCPNAPNLFELCPPGVIAAANEEKYSMSKAHKLITQRVLGAVDWTRPYFNSGVMIFDRKHKDIFNPENPILRKWISCEENNDHIMSDQPILNYLVNHENYDFIDLGYKFNRTRVLKDTHNRFKSYFIHYAGPSGHRYGARLTQIKSDCEVASSSTLFFLSKNFSSFRWTADRFCLSFIEYVYRKIKP